MRIYPYALVVALSLLAACAPQQKIAVTPAPAKPQQAPFSLERMDTQFLYMAAQRALGQEKPVLAVRFLKALVRKDVDAVAPRLELAELLLAAGQKRHVQEARRILEHMPEATRAALSGDHLAHYQFLYARILLMLGDSATAFSLLENLLKAHPEDTQVRLLMVRLYLMKKDWDAASVLLVKGMKHYDNVRLRQMQVHLFLQQGKPKSADKALARMQKKYPDHEDVVLQRSQLAEQQGQSVKAELYLQQYIAKHADVAVLSYAALAGLYVRQEKLAEAIAIYEKMLPLTHASADVYMSLGKIYYQMSDYDLAIAVFGEAVLRLTPKHEQPVSQVLAAAYFYLAASLEASHTWQEAVPVYLQVTREHAFYLDAQLRLANIEMSQKQEQKAEKRLLHLKTLFADKLEVHEVLSGLRLQQKAYNILLEETKVGLDVGFSSMLLFNRAIAFDALKQFDDLDKSLDTLLNKEPEHAETLNFYGYSLAERGVRLEDARNMVQRALKIKPNDGYYLDSLAWVYFKQKKYKKALHVQLKAVHKIDNDPVMQEHLGDMYWLVGKHAQARKVWQKSLDLKHEKNAEISRKIEHGLK